MITILVVDSRPEADRINSYQEGSPEQRSLIAVAPFQSVPCVRADWIIINRAVQTAEWRAAIGGERYDRWEREVLLHRLAAGRERAGLIML